MVRSGGFQWGDGIISTVLDDFSGGHQILFQHPLHDKSKGLLLDYLPGPRAVPQCRVVPLLAVVEVLRWCPKFLVEYRAAHVAHDTYSVLSLIGFTTAILVMRQQLVDEMKKIPSCVRFTVIIRLRRGRG